MLEVRTGSLVEVRLRIACIGRLYRNSGRDARNDTDPLKIHARVDCSCGL